MKRKHIAAEQISMDCLSVDPKEVISSFLDKKELARMGCVNTEFAEITAKKRNENKFVYNFTRNLIGSVKRGLPGARGRKSGGIRHPFYAASKRVWSLTREFANYFNKNPKLANKIIKENREIFADVDAIFANNIDLASFPDISDLPQIQSVSCSGNRIKELGLEYVKFLDCSNNLIQSLRAPNIETVLCQSNELISLDLPKAINIDCSFNPDLSLIDASSSLNVDLGCTGISATPNNEGANLGDNVSIKGSGTISKQTFVRGELRDVIGTTPEKLDGLPNNGEKRIIDIIEDYMYPTYRSSFQERLQKQKEAKLSNGRSAGKALL